MDMEVYFEEMPGNGGNLGIITLNRPQALNSLNLNMVHAMMQQLTQWEVDDHIKAVVIRAVPGKAFCAGGDIRLAYERMQTHAADVAEFFRHEYQLNRKIYHYGKPYIALLNGITMGGGVGISLHGSHRVATEKLVFAMPETGIGFFPDVGGTYFLPRIPDRIGIYLGLTGERIDAHTCLQLGIVTHTVAEDAILTIPEKLAQQPFGHDAKKSVSDILQALHITLAPSELLSQQSIIRQYFSADKMETIMQTLANSADEFCQHTLKQLQKKSPTSLKVSLLAMQKGSQQDFDAGMRMEYRLVNRFLQGHDFAEGIRALIIDKDQKPAWSPDSLQAVSDEEVAAYFVPITEELTYIQ